MFWHRNAVRWGLPALLLVTAAWIGRGGESDPELARDEQSLREAGQAVDGPALLAFFRQRTIEDGRRRRVADLVRRLGDDSFAVRERATTDLIQEGHVALPPLRAALKDPDPEVVRRAEHCLKVIGQESELGLTLAAARLLAARRPDGAAEALLAYLPSADEEVVEEAVLSALLGVGLADGKPAPALAAALTDREPSRRAAAAFVVGRAAPEQRRPVHRLLTDPDARVRLRAAASLARAGEKPAVGALLALLEDAPLALASQAEDLLCRIAGEQAPQAPLGPGTDARRACRAAWEKWWQASEGKIDLAKVNLDAAALGLTLVCDCDVPTGSIGRLWECRADGRPRWQIDNLGNPADVQVLPGGRFLIAECQGRIVTERDRQGTVHWSHRVSGHPVSCQRLPGGNTFIATYNELLEVTRDGKTVYSHPRTGASIYCAQKLPNGNLLFAQGSGNIVEMETGGKEVRTIAVGSLASWAGVEPLPGGRYLVAQYAAGRVVEIDAVGKVFWECSVTSPAWATRLPNGHTLVTSTDARCLVEFDRAGKEARKQPTHGRPFRARRY
jgi:hypothetical protein